MITSARKMKPLTCIRIDRKKDTVNRFIDKLSFCLLTIRPEIMGSDASREYQENIRRIAGFGINRLLCRHLSSSHSASVTLSDAGRIQILHRGCDDMSTGDTAFIIRVIVIGMETMSRQYDH